MKKLITLLLMLPVAASAFAVEAEIDGLWYEILTKGNVAKVIRYKNNITYSGNIVIPGTIEYEGVKCSVSSIETQAFSGCEITSVTIPNSVTSIGNSSFNNCSSLISVSIPNSVTSIGDSAFEFCSGLTSVTIQNGVKSIGRTAFEGCSSLTSITIPNSVTSIGSSAFYDCSSLASITIPNDEKIIGSGTFYGCSSLTSVTIPNSVKSIESSAFENCSRLIRLNIGSSVQTIEDKAFAYCPELADVYCHAPSVPSTNKYAFTGSYTEYATLHVPTASISAYKLKSPWIGFKAIVGIEDTTPETSKCATPTISYAKGELSFGCATDGVEYVSEITDADIKKHYDAKISLTATYNISVYATKVGYDNSDVATATLCWIDVEPKSENIVVGQSELRALPVLIKSRGGVLTVEGVNEGTSVSVYDTAGRLVGSGTATAGMATVATTLRSGDVCIVKIGDKSVKVMIK